MILRKPIARRLWIALGILVLVALGAGIAAAPALNAGAGTAAHNLCSSTFVSGLPEQQTEEELVGLLVGPASRLLHYHVDRAAHVVDARLLFATATARYTEGFGCRLDFGETPLAALPVAPLPQPEPDAFAPAQAVQTDNPVLRDALDHAFTDPPGQTPRHVKAVVIVKDGRVIAERYAPGFGIDTPVMSFSVAKSFTNAFLGILARQGKITMDAPASVPEWRGAGDARGKITNDDLLRMDSGLDAHEGGTGFDPASQMFYNRSDMGAYGANRPAAKAPRGEWDYTSVNTLLLDREMRDIVGDPSAFRRFADEELLRPLGMRHVTLEFDGAGTFLGASHVYAPPREFARFGLLYLNDGIAPNGQRILPPGWVDYSRKSTLGSTYGAGFWTNDGASEFAASRVAQGFPKDGFFASGNLGQRIYIIPSEHMVIVRFGYSHPPDFGIRDDLALIKTAITAAK